MRRTAIWIGVGAMALCACSESSNEQGAGNAADAAPEAAPQAAAPVREQQGMEEIEAAAKTLGVVQRAAVWDNPTIPVCWESMAPAQAQGRRWTQEAIEGSWESASRVDFTGWGRCAAGARGVRIEVADAGAHTLGLGKRLDGVRNGMRLNFTMDSWNRTCRENSGLEACIRLVGIHEFGHALAFAHEQNRPETAEVAGDDCARRAQGTTGDWPLTPWDRSSVMNYCNPVYGNNGRLSAGDITAVQTVYGLPTS